MAPYGAGGGAREEGAARVFGFGFWVLGFGLWALALALALGVGF
jgi:hypothetical protein